MESKEEEHKKSLYIRFPHTIKDMDEIRDIVFNETRIKLPRQSGRHCIVVFSSVEDKLKNLKALKTKLIDNKPLIIRTPRLSTTPKPIKKPKKKKVSIIKSKPMEKITKILFISNISEMANIHELKEALGECQTITFIPSPHSTKNALVRLKDINLAKQYLRKERDPPVLYGKTLKIRPDTREKKKKQKEPSLKIWDGDVDISKDVKFKNNKIKIEERNEVN